jgi:hypothetical protein
VSGNITKGVYYCFKIIQWDEKDVATAFSANIRSRDLAGVGSVGRTIAAIAVSFAFMEA